ncbi:MAG: M50 family metallopeptidase [Wujia sp.]
MNIILIILVFGIIVFFHEFGHFIVAKLNKISVTEFSIGMGPALFSVQKKETKYSLRLLPLGGFCMMMGEDEELEDENAFGNKPVWARMLVIAAGPVFNFILAFIFSIVLIHYTGCDPATLYDIVEGSPAQEAGIEAGDTILEIEGDNIYNFRELQLYMAMNNEGKPFELTLQHENGEVYTTTVTPELTDGSYMLGVRSGNVLADGFGMTMKYAALECRYWVKSTVLSLKMIVTGGVKGADVMGPVGVGGVMNDIIEEVKEESDTQKDVIINILLNMMNWCILLSVNLGIMNLLPIPALDGGRLLFLLIEAVRRKKIPQDKEAIVNLVGFVLLICLMVVVFCNDIKNVFFS